MVDLVCYNRTMIKESSGYCHHCEALRLIRVRGTRPMASAMHALLTLATLGLWGIVWAQQVRRVVPWRCTVCGTVCEPGVEQADSMTVEGAHGARALTWAERQALKRG